jgi:serine/threonine protein phosphatase PrpC
MISCPSCNAQNRDGARFCQSCGTPLSPASPLVSVAETLETKPLAQESTAMPEPLPAGQRASDVQTKLLPLPEFASLPPGELLEKRRYEIVSVINKSPKLNAYRVQDCHFRQCPQCDSAATKSDGKFCRDCGLSFSGQPAEHPNYLLRETLDREMLAQEARIAKLELRHEGMVNIHRAFEDRPYGPRPRLYLVSDLDEGTGLAALPRPQPEEKILTWGKQLAEALAYLHGQGVRHRNIRPENIRLVDSQAKLTNFNLAEKPPRAAPREWFAEDVEALARLLQRLLVGQPASPAVAAIFDKALALNKADRYATADALAADLKKVLEALQRPANVTFIVGRRSDTGRQRELNEDSLLTLEIERVQQSESQPVGLYVVADGMGGHSAGEVASAMAINALARTVLTTVMLPVVEEAIEVELDHEALLKEACVEANRAVHKRARKTRSDMGTTLVAALVVGSEAVIANIGDSRAYRVNQREIRPITTDHSLVERLIAAGQISREEARTHPQRNVIYRTVGDKPQVAVDVFHESLKRDDWLILCSDGLNGMVEDAQIQQVVMTCPHPQDACEELVRLANEAGGDDNITVIALRLEEVGSTG